ncbi:hypothetical protein GCM10022243_34340 [Saccharothrix violaceirubra]|uniref:Uncharacterized protein n=1 Tax=Saccharothrix violaceirubra TaxID=413306 RepID=A0A7W7WWM0_9PSEU|nr:hypothetical protein [Saccharothrix violaceirubra]MBB4966485.1 hypothetical protein [Saccharothrix violaceirubra]
MRHRTSLRHFGDSPYALIWSWLLLIGLLFVDVPLLKSALGAAAPTDHWWQSWLIAAGYGVALAATTWPASVFTLRRIEHGESRHLAAAVVFWVIWAAGVIASFVFRLLHPQGTTSADQDSFQLGEQPVETGTGPDPGNAVVLTLLVLMTGAVASGIAALGEDDLQRQRRRAARRVQRLTWRTRWANRRADRHGKAMEVQKDEIVRIEGRLAIAVEQTVGLARGLKHHVRHTIAVALGDPRATTAVTHAPDAAPADTRPTEGTTP